MKLKKHSDLGLSLKPVLQVMLGWSERYLYVIEQKAAWWEEVSKP